ncbi:normocyte-binding protein [Clostridium chromiireducens]|uniref:Normocyte-binding protein n=1 Tax=Clostridium chromiireducens TaxID=225345 RepID=A0A1V4IU97_9CLOT|nr:normocyte-binding protein [Clostridium chromiireducens]OPJ63473.1 hypothetical protein CLCHR_15520 [Clostridium chromiireducens]
MKLQDVDLRKLYRTWKSGLGPFQGFFRSTPFVSLQTYENFELKAGSENKCRQDVVDKIKENLDENNFTIVDLPLNEILDTALVLNNKYSIKPILNINLLFHPFGIVGDRVGISKLINNGLKLNKVNSNKIVMLIPSNRYDNNLEVKYLEDKLNNQYGVGEDDLPYVNMLKELKYNGVVILTRGELKEDLRAYIDSISKDIKVEIIRVML